MPVFYSPHSDLMLCMMSCLLLISAVAAVTIAREKTFSRPLHSWIFLGLALFVLAAREWVGIIGLSKPSFVSLFPVAAIMHTAAALLLVLAVHRETPPGANERRSLAWAMVLVCLVLLGFLLQPYAQHRHFLMGHDGLATDGLFFLTKSGPVLVSLVLLANSLKKPRPVPRAAAAILVLVTLYCLLLALSHPPGIPHVPTDEHLAFFRDNTVLFLCRIACALALAVSMWVFYSRVIAVSPQICWWRIGLLIVFLILSSAFVLISAEQHARVVARNLAADADNAANALDPGLLRQAARNPDSHDNAPLFAGSRRIAFYEGYAPVRIAVDAIAAPASDFPGPGQPSDPDPLGRDPLSADSDSDSDSDAADASAFNAPVAILDPDADSTGGRWNPEDKTLVDKYPELTEKTAVHPVAANSMKPLLVTAPVRDPAGRPAGVAVLSVSRIDLARDTYLQKRGLLMYLPPAFLLFLLLFSGLQRSWRDSDTTNRLNAIRAGALGNDLTGVLIAKGPAIVDCNQRLLDIMGASRQDIVGLSLHEAFGPVDPRSTAEAVKTYLPEESPQSVAFETIVRGKAGNKINLLVYGRAIENSRGLIEHYIWEAVDITRQKEMENQIRFSRDILQMTLDTIPVGVSLTDGNGIYQIVNKAFRRQLNLPEDTSVVGKHTVDFLPEGVEIDRQQDRLALELKGKSVVYEQTFTIDGETRYFEISKTAASLGDSPDLQLVAGSMHDITARKAAAETLRSERHFLMQLVNSLPLSMCFIDTDGIVRICDRGFARDAGVDDPRRLVGTRYADIAPYGPARLEEDARPRDEAAEYQDRDFEFVKDGKTRNYTIRRITIRDADGRPRGLLKAFWDNTDLVAANHAAKTAERAKAAFLANMSHELRTPMNGVVGMADLIIDHEATEPLQRLYAETIIKSAKTLQMVMDEVMDVAALDDGVRKIRLAVAPFPLLTLAEESAQIVSCIIEAWGARLNFSYDFNLPSVFQGGARHIRQIIVQILTHCSRITSDKRLHFKIENARDDRVSLKAVFRKAKELTAGEIEAMFKKPSSERVDAAMNLGMFDDRIGLPLAWRLIDAMHGSLTITADGDLITCDTVLPLRPDDKAAPHVTTPEALKNAAVVVATTSNDNARAANACLIHAGCVVSRASSSEEIGKRLEEMLDSGHRRPILLLDNNVLEDDKLEDFLLHLDASPHFGNTDVLLYIDSRLAQNMQNLPKNVKYLSIPPLCPTDVWYKADAILHQRASASVGGGRPPSSKVIVRRPSDRLARQIKIDAKVLLVEDNTVNQMVAMGLLKRLGCNPSLAKNGKDAVDMIERGDSYDFILMDCMMPVMDGYEATRQIRQYEKRESGDGSNNTIIALTANNVAGDRERCLAAGMDGYIPKPVTLDTLRDAIARTRPDLVTIVDEIS